jgi:hypothetical protein
MTRSNLLLSATILAMTAAASLAQPPTAPAPRPAETDNPTVEPGKVKWHKSFADAKAAAADSGKPILLFQMMGRLDQQFT